MTIASFAVAYAVGALTLAPLIAWWLWTKLHERDDLDLRDAHARAVALLLVSALAFVASSAWLPAKCEELAQAINLPKMILLIATWPLSLPAIITFEMATRNR